MNRTIVEGFPKSKHPLYSIWAGMIARCHGKTTSAINYKDKGISVCTEWRESFEKFVKDMGERPSDKHTLDRINNDGNYEPGNVRWATRSDQVHNTSGVHRNVAVYNGVIWDEFDKRWKVRISVDRKNYNIGKYRDLDEALSARLSAESLLWDSKVDPKIFVNSSRILYNRGYSTRYR